MLTFEQLEPLIPREPTYIDPSGFNEFTRCPAKYCLRRIFGLKDPQSHPAPDFGTSIHAAMPFLHRKELEKACGVFETVWTAFGHEESSKRSIETGYRILTDYFADQIIADKIPYNVIAPPEAARKSHSLAKVETYSPDEFAFCLDIGAQLLFAGRSDAIGRSKQSGKLWGIEYKTTSESGARFVSCFNQNPQVIGYQISNSIMFPNEIIEGTFVEGIRVSETNSALVRIPCLVNPHLIETMLDELKRVAERIQTAWRLKQFSQYFSACNPYSQYAMPGYNCDFSNICSSPHPENFLEAYEVKFFTPFEELEEETEEKEAKSKEKEACKT